MQTSSLNGFDTKIVGTTNDYSKTSGSDIADKRHLEYLEAWDDKRGTYLNY